MLLQLNDIEKRLDDLFRQLEPAITGLRLLPSPLSELQCDELAEDLSVLFPFEFRDMLTQYDFGHFTIGPIAFCNTGDFGTWLRNGNSTKSPVANPWWGAGHRPSQWLLIANSDPFAVLLDCVSGAIFVFHHEQCWSKRTRVAHSFVLFVRGLGTVWVLRGERRVRSLLAQEVAQAVCDGQGISFWEWFSH